MGLSGKEHLIYIIILIIEVLCLMKTSRRKYIFTAELVIFAATLAMYVCGLKLR